ncbi:MAG: hypothetical protein U9M90_01100 [Patescibacteria group bacterium]|nr:hypothetical protein [Patescibacteria group bacterium]
MNSSQRRSVNKEQLLRLQACPMSASVNWDPRDDVQADVVEWYTHFNKLPFDIRVGLADEKVIEKILLLAKKYKIEDEFKVGEISRMIRRFFFEPNNQEVLTEQAKDKLKIKKEDGASFYENLMEIIELAQKEGREQFDKMTESIPIIPALKKYQKLKEQIVTKNNLKVLETGNFVRSTLGNWIDDYIQRKGAQSHDNIKRSDYLFNSVNGQKLSIEERKKMGKILESYDNDSVLDIHTEDQEVVFPDGYQPKKTEELYNNTNKGKNSGGKNASNAIQEKHKNDNTESTSDLFHEMSPKAFHLKETRHKEDRENPLEQWKNRNLQAIERKNAPVWHDRKDTEKTLKNSPTYFSQQKIGWFGKKTGAEDMEKVGIESVSFQQPEDQFNLYSQKGKERETRPKTIIRNYREVGGAQKSKSKHVIDLKEIV